MRGEGMEKRWGKVRLVTYFTGLNALSRIVNRLMVL